MLLNSLVLLFGYFYLEYSSKVKDAFNILVKNDFSDTWSVCLVIGIPFYLYLWISSHFLVDIGMGNHSSFCFSVVGFVMYACDRSIFPSQLPKYAPKRRMLIQREKRNETE